MRHRRTRRVTDGAQVSSSGSRRVSVLLARTSLLGELTRLSKFSSRVKSIHQRMVTHGTPECAGHTSKKPPNVRRTQYAFCSQNTLAETTDPFYTCSIQDATCSKYILAQKKDTKLYIPPVPS